jgi:sodium-dependent dicarboxylate transporter 2/3/5
MEKWNLHRRIALNIIKLTGTTPSTMILGFFIATLLLSMWVSNTACAVMMVPIAIAVAKSLTGKTTDPGQIKKESNFSKSLLLTVAYASTIGGITTIIATPANGIAVSMLRREYGLNVTFLQWMLIGVPLALVMSAFVWFMLTKVLFRTGDLKLLGGRDVIEDEHKKLGPMSRGEKSVLAVAGLMVFCWITRGFINVPALEMVTDTQIAIAGTLLLFLLPARKGEKLLDWQTAVKIPWGICLLFGGGIAIAAAFRDTGLAVWISGNLASISGMTLFTAVLISTAVVCCLTEITSNTAIASLFIPIMGATAIALGVHPYATVMAICFSSSMCFAMPVATPPNAIAYASGYIKIKDMAYAGLILNFVTILMVFSAIIWLLPIVWGVDLGTVPQSVLDYMNN